MDYTLRVKVNPETQPVAVALIEAKAEHLPPGHGLAQAKLYAACKRLNVPFVFSSNGRLFVEFDRLTGMTRPPRPLAQFPTPAMPTGGSSTLASGPATWPGWWDGPGPISPGPQSGAQRGPAHGQDTLETGAGENI